MSFDAIARVEAYRFFAIAFGAAPGETHLRDIALAYEGGAPTKQVVNEFTKKGPFKAVYPDTLSEAEFAVNLVTNVVGNAATAEAKAEATLDIVLALRGGATRGDVVYQIFTNLAGLRGDAKWGSLAAKLDKQVEVARFYTDTLNGPSLGLDQLRSVIAGVDGNTDTSAAALQARLTPLLAADLSGKVIDGYVKGATVFIDYNGNGVVDTDLERQTVTKTDDAGGYKIKSLIAGGVITASGGVNVDTGLPNTLVLKTTAVPGENTSATRNLTPITTLITEVASAGKAPGAVVSQADIAKAEASVKQSLGLTAVSISLLTLDPVATASSTTASAQERDAALKVFKVGVQVALVTVAAQNSAATDADKQAASKAVLSALANTIATAAVSTPAPGAVQSTLDLSKVDVISQVLTAAKVPVNSQSVAAVAATSSQVSTASNLTTIAMQQTVLQSGTTTQTPAGSNSTSTGGTSSGGGTGSGGTTTPANTAPQFDAASATASIVENTTAVGTYTATDPGDTLTYTLGGADAAKFEVNSATGALSFKVAPNFEVDAKSYSVSVTATDRGGLTATQSITVNVNDVNEAPAITSGATASVGDGVAAGTVAYTTLATDPDAGQALTYSLSGTDAGLLNINSATGVVSLKAAADRSTKPTYSFNVVATDNGNGALSATQAVTVTVNPSTNRAPSITSASTVSVIENTATITPAYTVVASDADAGQQVTYSLGTGGDEALFNIDATTGAVTLKTAADFEAKRSYSITVRATDNGTPALTVQQVVAINVTDINEAPVGVADTFTASQDTAITFTAADLIGNDRDQDANTTLAVDSVANGTGGTVARNDNGTVTFTPTAGFFGAATFTYVTTDGALKSAPTTVSVNVEDKRAPTATLTLAAASAEITKGETGTLTIEFSEEVKEFDLSDITGTNLLASASKLTQSPTNKKLYTLEFKALDNLTVAENVFKLADTYTDLAGNRGGTATSGNYSIDTAAPTATIVINDNDLTVGETATVTITFSEPVLGFTSSKLVPEGAKFSLGALSEPINGANGTVSYTTTLTPNANTSSATNALSLATGAVKDRLGNDVVAVSSANFNINTVPPTQADNTSSTPTNQPFTVSGSPGSTLIQIGGYDGNGSDAISITFTVNPAVGTVNATFTYRGTAVSLSNVGGKSIVTPTGKFNLNVTGTDGNDRLQLVVLDATTEINLSGDLKNGNDTISLFFADVGGMGTAGTNSVLFKSTLTMSGAGDKLFIQSQDSNDKVNLATGSSVVDAESIEVATNTTMDPAQPFSGATVVGVAPVTFPA